MYILKLNDMRSAHSEDRSTSVFAETLGDLWAYLKGEHGPWTDQTWGKIFKKGSKLEWCNGPSIDLMRASPPSSEGEWPGLLKTRTRDEWMDEIANKHQDSPSHVIRAPRR